MRGRLTPSAAARGDNAGQRQGHLPYPLKDLGMEALTQTDNVLTRSRRVAGIGPRKGIVTVGLREAGGRCNGEKDKTDVKQLV